MLRDTYFSMSHFTCIIQIHNIYKTNKIHYSVCKNVVNTVDHKRWDEFYWLYIMVARYVTDVHLVVVFYWSINL